MATLENLLKVTVDAISEEQNHAGGILITRLRENHLYGRDDGSADVGSPTQLTSPVNVFDSGMVGQGIDILEKDTPTGNEGSYVIATYVDEKNVTLNKIDGVAAALVTETDVRWRFTTLRVETTYEFPRFDKLLQLWIDREPEVCPYAEIVQTPGAQEFRGLGDHALAIDGEIEVANPQTLKTIGEFFDSSMVGHAVWVLERDTATGNEGPRRITAVVSSREATLAGDAFTADEDDVYFVVKSYDWHGSGYLTEDRLEDSEVVDGSGSYSAIDKLRRSFLVDHATEDELDRLGRRYGLLRARTFDDETYRRYVKVRAYLPATTVHAFELVLDALFPQGGWEVYEDLINRPNEIFITLPTQLPGNDFEGRAFLAPSGATPYSASDVDRDGMEKQTSSSSTAVAVEHDAITVTAVECQDVQQELEMTVLPSADSPAWSYVNEGAAEGTIFSVSSSALSHNQASVNGGRYERQVLEIDNSFGNVVSIRAWWRLTASTTINGYPWHIGIYDGSLNRQMFLFWDDTQAVLADDDETIRFGPVTPLADLDDGNMHRFELTRVTMENGGSFLTASIDGEVLFPNAAISSFGSTSDRKFSFGYHNNGGAQNWGCQWDRVRIFNKSRRNYYNLRRGDGSLVGFPTITMSSASGLFVSGDTGKHIMLYGDEGRNHGLWEMTYSNSTTIVLDGIERDGANVDEADDDVITFDHPWIREEDVPKRIVISGSSENNDGTYEIQAWGGQNGLTGADLSLTRYQVRVDVTGHPDGGFNTETNLTWKFQPYFDSESGIRWEIVGAGSVAGKNITLRDSLPNSSQPVRIWYTAVLSAQALENESVTNEGSDGAEPNIFYPFYLWDVDMETRSILEDVSAEGVIPKFERDW